MLDERWIRRLEELGIDEIEVRSPITCATRHGICATCYGRDLARGHKVNIGEAIGVVAAQSIGEPGTQLTMRTFHIGGAASRATAQDNIQIINDGTVRLHNVKTVARQDGTLIAVSRSGELSILDKVGRERERYKLPYGAIIKVADDAKVTAGEIVATWDPHTHPIITEVAGTVKFSGMDEGITIKRKTDELTGLSSIEVMDPGERPAAGKDVRPAITLVDDNGEELCLAIRTCRPTTSSRPWRWSAWKTAPRWRPATLSPASRRRLEDARHHRWSAACRRSLRGAQAQGTGDSRGDLRHRQFRQGDQGQAPPGDHADGRTLLPDGSDHYESLIPKWRNLSVFEGESVQKGEMISEGPLSPHDILRLKGISELAKYIVNEIQEVYRLQGVKINDKHIEVIVRQMLRKVLITSPGDSNFIKGEQVEYTSLLEENERLQAEGLVPAGAERELLGITKASLATESFISAASFQETTRVLTEAAVTGKRDYLRGLKENVVVGRLIPAGTGLTYHEERRKRSEEDREMAVSAEDIEAALTEALQESAE
jgi:DNA-directed RNA polymerase subunit beta'